MIERLTAKIEALTYRVEQYGDLGAEAELESLQRQLWTLEGKQGRHTVFGKPLLYAA